MSQLQVSVSAEGAKIFPAPRTEQFLVNLHVYIYIHIYIYKERERERELEKAT